MNEQIGVFKICVFLQAKMISQVEENYLKAIFQLSEGSGLAGSNEISKHLNIKMPTVNSMMKKLAEKGLVIYESYKPIKLTAKGRKEAALIIRRHRLTEMFLVEKMGFGWEEVHSIAEQLEHLQSEAFFLKMDEMLGFPTKDPHGSPIPDKNGKIINEELIKLSACKAGDQVILNAVRNSSEDFLKYLNSKEISLGLKMKIKLIEAFDKSVLLSYGKHKNQVFSATVCDNLLVTKI